MSLLRLLLHFTLLLLLGTKEKKEKYQKYGGNYTEFQWDGYRVH